MRRTWSMLAGRRPWVAVLPLLLLVLAPARADEPATDPFEGQWSNPGGEAWSVVTLQRAADGYDLLLEKNFPIEGARWSRIDGFRCRLDDYRLVPAEHLFRFFWSADGELQDREPSAVDGDIELSRDGDELVLFRAENPDVEVPLFVRKPLAAVGGPPLGTWTLDIANRRATPPQDPADDGSGFHLELMIVRRDEGYAVAHLRESPPARWESRYLARSCGAFLSLTHAYSSTHHDDELVNRDEFGSGSAYVVWRGDQVVWYQPYLKSDRVPPLLFPKRYAAITDGSFDGEWSGEGTFTGNDGRRRAFAYDASVKAVMGDLYTVDISFHHDPVDADDPTPRWSTAAFCRGSGGADGTLELTGGASSAWIGDSEPAPREGWAGTATLTGGRLRLRAGPGDVRWEVLLSRRE